MTDPQIVSLFSGYGGLEMGVQAVVGGHVLAHVEFDAAPSAVLAHHWPTTPNLGDVAAVDWNAFIADHPELADLSGTYRPGLIIVGGFPCQDVSLAGLRRGLKDGTRSGLWTQFARAIDSLRPELVVIENVRGLLSAEADREMESSPWGVGDRPDGPALRALGAVLGDLAELGYDAEWCGVRAADAGATHGRFRVFIVARPAHPHDDAARSRQQPRVKGGSGTESAQRGRSVANARDNGFGSVASADNDDRALALGYDADGRPVADPAGRGRDGRSQGAVRGQIERATAAGSSRATHATADAGSARLREHSGKPSAQEAGPLGSDVAAGAGGLRPPLDWGPYRTVVERWERVTGRVAPSPTSPTGTWTSMIRRRRARLDKRPVGMRGSLAVRRSLAPEFVEWMMGLPAGHVTSAPITRAQMLKALGNGVVPQQAALAVRTLLERAGWTEWALAA